MTTTLKAQDLDRIGNEARADVIRLFMPYPVPSAIEGVSAILQNHSRAACKKFAVSKDWAHQAWRNASSLSTMKTRRSAAPLTALRMASSWNRPQWQWLNSPLFARSFYPIWS